MLSLVIYSLLVGQPSESVRLDDVRDLIETKGKAETLSFLMKNHARWDSFLSMIGKGESEWLDVAAQLKSVADAHASETLDMAVQEALPVNPRGVLKLVSAGTFTINDACGMYGFGQIEDERPKAIIIELVERRINAVARIETPPLSSVREDCLGELTQLRERMTR